MYDALIKAVKEHSELTEGEIIEAGNHGADAGWSGFIYNVDCIEFYNNNKNLINDLLKEQSEEFGYDNIVEFIATFNRKDMLDNMDSVMVLLAWYALEQAGRYLENKE